LKSTCQNLGFSKIYCRICINLLRYTKEVRPDKAFYEAGLACKNDKQINLSFVFFNRFLDLADAIDDPESATGENNDFADTDIPSLYDIVLPDKNYISEEKRSEIKDWILSVSVQKKTDLSLPCKPCERCGAKLYDYSQRCTKCNYEWETCIVTGAPLFANVPSIKCKFCNKIAIKEYWNEYVQKQQHCPWCDNVQTIY
jgi:intraflagellar transport protein 172